MALVFTLEHQSNAKKINSILFKMSKNISKQYLAVFYSLFFSYVIMMAKKNDF